VDSNRQAAERELSSSRHKRNNLGLWAECAACRNRRDRILGGIETENGGFLRKMADFFET
jgi:hypothetical protein